MWGVAPRGWCALLLSLYGFDFAGTVRTTSAVSCSRGFPSLSKEGSVGAELRDKTSLGEMGLVLLSVLLYDGLFLNHTSLNTECLANYARSGGFILLDKR